MRLGRTNGLDACYQHWTLATEKLTWTSVCRLHQRPSMRTNGFCVTKMFPWSLASNFLILWWLRWSVLELVNANCTNRNFENLMCIAVNFYVKSSGPPGSIDWTQQWHSILTICHLASVDVQLVKWDDKLSKNKCNWTVMNFGPTGACLNIGNLFSMLHSWMITVGWNEHWCGMLEVAGGDDLLIYGMPLWQNFAGGRTLESVAGCSPGQSSLAAVPAGLCNIYAYVIYLLGLTPCALNGLTHHGIQEQSQKSKSNRVESNLLSVRGRETTKVLVSTHYLGIENFNKGVHMCQPKSCVHCGCPPFS